ncbi:hypothetical protein MLIT_16670 [Mycolicibacterium litorale]|uniref:DUF4185 domain-containing protein n=1 Tax=Mycolicibacterium litorale TaxID=758802 RepID=A0AAD1II23_9MYCO|nr:uncharacterized protein DUF4185 [Mycolicibacterium litorale]BBY16075.1 hypothetical protein MLIT_16670 [Mycolicibacterium litorale]
MALGVGAAVTFGHGVASADTSDSSSPSSASSSAESGSESESESGSSESPSSSESTNDESAENEADAPADDEPEEVADEEVTDEVTEEEAAEEPADSVEDPASGDEPVQTPADEPDEVPVDETVDEPVAETPEPPTDGPAGSSEPAQDEPSGETVDEVVDEAADDDTAESDETVVETPAEPVAADGTVGETASSSPGGPAAVGVGTGTQTNSRAMTFAAAAPSVRALPAPPNVPAMISGFLAAVGLAPLAAALPTAPAAPPTLWAMLALARREFERAFARPNLSVAPSGVVTTAAATPFPTTLPSINKGWVTGKVPNNFGISGTDLGIMWDGGIRLGERFVHVAFGDTFANANMTGDWRSNVLLVSTDHNLGNGLQLVQTGYAGRFIGPFSGRLGLFGSEVTQIPTSGIQIDGRQFVNFMSVKSWDTPGRWTTNYSAISVYDPATDKWVLAPSTIRSAGWFRSTTRYVPGSQNFQQSAYVLQPEDQVGEDGIRYLYAFGTPSGRAGSAYLSRVAEGSVTDLSKYEYWNGDRWVANRPAAAAPIIGDSTRSAGLFGFVVDWANDPNVLGGYLGGLFGAKTGGNVSEMSVQYNEYLGKYVVLYGDGNNDIRLRTADTPEGPWSAPVTIATSKQYPGLYAPMIHPWSGTGDLRDSNNQPDLNNLYWNMSLWGDYNVVLMQTDLSPLKAVYV